MLKWVGEAVGSTDSFFFNTIKMYMYTIQKITQKTDFDILAHMDYSARSEDMHRGNMIMSIAEWWKNIFDNLPEWYYFLCKNSEKIGYARLVVSPFERVNFRYVLGPFYISPEYRWQGLSTIFWNLLEAEILKNTIAPAINIVLTVNAENIAAIKSYKKSGFVIFGEEKFHTQYNWKYQNAFHMQKIIKIEK